MIGFLAFTIASTAAFTALWSAAARLVLRGSIIFFLMRTSFFAISSGNSSTVTPGFSCSAILKAFLTISGIVSGL